MRNAKNRRQMTLLTLVVALGVAVYLNWEYARNETGFNALPASQAVNAAAGQAQMDLSEAELVDQAVLTSPDAQAAATQTADEIASQEAAKNNDTDLIPNKNYGDSQLVSATVSSSDKYFDEARLTRSKARDEALDKLQKSLKSASLTQDEKAQLTQNLTQVLSAITTESDIENLVKAKGFTDCVAFVDGVKANITVKTGGEALNTSSVAQIRDIVLGKLDTEAKNITIVEVK